MDVEKIIAICGVSCKKCDAYNATRLKDNENLKILATQWTEAMNRHFSAEDIRCDGCRTEGKNLSSYCGTCGIRLCAESRNHPTCAHCPESPCEKIVAPIAQEALRELRKILKEGL